MAYLDVGWMRFHFPQRRICFNSPSCTVHTLSCNFALFAGAGMLPFRQPSRLQTVRLSVKPNKGSPCKTRHLSPNSTPYKVPARLVLDLPLSLRTSPNTVSQITCKEATGARNLRILCARAIVEEFIPLRFPDTFSFILPLRMALPQSMYSIENCLHAPPAPIGPYPYSYMHMHITALRRYRRHCNT